MIAYTMLGTNDLEKALGFYGPLMESIGAREIFTNPNGAKFYSIARGQPMLGIGKPADGGEATFGNGTMIAIPFEETEKVDAFHAKALELGGTDDGEPGWRLQDVFYGAYVRDPDGNKICACVMNFG